MRHITILLYFLLLTITMSAQRRGTMDIAGTMCEYDTLDYRRIGPGAKYTQFQFNNISYQGKTYKMRAHVIEIDNSNRNNYLTSYMAKDDYYKINTQVQQVELEKQKGLKPIATMAGVAWFSVHGESEYKAYELQGNYIKSNEVYYSGRESGSCFYKTTDSVAHIGNINLSASVNVSDKKLVIGQVNHCRDHVDKDGYITLFCNGMSSWAADEKTGTEVLLKVKSSNGCIVRGTNNCEVVEVLSGSGHDIASDECILSTCGMGESSLQQLAKGEDVDIKIEYLDENDGLAECSDVINLCWYDALKSGEVVPWDRNNVAYPCIGVSQDGKTTYLADIESTSNSNAPVDCLSYLLKNIGTYNAHWMDGGPSAEMTVWGDWVTVNSMGGGFNGRYIPGGIILYSVAPNDSVITNIELADPSPRSVYIGESFDINAYAYNQYGEVILSNAQTSADLELSCPSSLGTIENGIFTATGSGSGDITVRLKGTDIVKTIPVTTSTRRVLTASPHNLFSGEFRQCQETLTLIDDSGTHQINPADAVWTTRSHIVIKSCENGLIKPYIDGKVDVYVTYDGLCDTVHVTVENLKEDVLSLDMTDDTESPETPNVRLTSVPHYFTSEIKGEPGSIVSLFYTLGNGSTYVKSDTISADSTVTMKVILDYDAADTYPVTVSNISSSSKDCIPGLTRLIAYYTEPDGIKEVTISEDKEGWNKIYTLTGQRLSDLRRGINIVNRRKVLKSR